MTGHRRLPGAGERSGSRSLRAIREARAQHRLIRTRAVVVGGATAVAMLALAARLITLHVLEADRLEQLAARQQQETVVLTPVRGRLLDRAGRPLAVTVEAPSVYAVPSRIADPQAFARAVAPVLGLPVGDVVARLDRRKHFVWLARKVSQPVAERLQALRLGPQLGLRTEYRRVYPNGSLAAHVVGFAGIDTQGLAGAELGFDQLLRGVEGRATVERDAMGRPLIETQRIVHPPRDGADVVLTIDQVVQHIAERELELAVAQTRARAGIVLVMDPGTGELLAVAATPGFDPNRFDAVPPARWSNPAIAAVMEPGSTFKVILAAAALEHGAVRLQDVFTSDGTYRVAGHVIREAHGHVYRRQTLTDIIANSSNVGAAMVATRLGRERFYATIRRFGFGTATGVDLPGEAVGLVPPPDRWLGPGLQTIAFGQGISVTPLQLLAAGAALANDGAWVRPHVLRQVRDAAGRTVHAPAPDPARSVTSPQVARQVLAMMEEVVERGTGTLARLDGYRVAGKTGTAQKPAPGGGYRADAYVASFLGVVRTDRPVLAVFVVLDEPRGQYYGGVVAAPVFRAVAAQTLWHLRVAPAPAVDR
jgi:cell division protein FtsI/penicillin-binding protein 2